jgi:hypothetical protein
MDFISVVNNAIQDCIRKSWVLNEFVPMIYGKLTGDQGGPEGVTIVDDFQ